MFILTYLMPLAFGLFLGYAKMKTLVAGLVTLAAMFMLAIVLGELAVPTSINTDVAKTYVIHFVTWGIVYFGLGYLGALIGKNLGGGRRRKK